MNKKQTSAEVAKIASKLLKSKSSSSAVKKVAASDLAQARGKHKKK